MKKEPTKTISFQVSIDEYVRFLKEATHKKMNISEYILDIIMKKLEEEREKFKRKQNGE